MIPRKPATEFVARAAHNPEDAQRTTASQSVADLVAASPLASDCRYPQELEPRSSDFAQPVSPVRDLRQLALFFVVFIAFH